jgi:hypothetical protein
MAQIPQRKLRLVPLQIRNFWSAVSIARSGFGDETAMIVFSYLWCFWRNLRLPDFGLMARRQSMTLMSRRAPIALADIVSTAIHGWDVCWLDLELLRDCPMPDLLTYLETWPLAHRLLLVRSHSPLHGPHDEDRFCFEGKLPAPDDGAFYIYSSRPTPNGITRFDRDRFITGKRNSLHTTCDFYLIERDGVPIAITGLYTADFWPGIGWGGWGAMNRETAFRQTVFEALRLTEELARVRDLQWFCLETSDAETYRFLRKMYEYYGLELLIEIPNFFASTDPLSKGENYLVYGKRLTV